MGVVMVVKATRLAEIDPKYAGVPPQDFERENRKQTARGKGEAVTW